MWCSTNALNGLIGCGVSQDWTTHMIGHELTALHGMDHGQSLAVIMPALWKHQLAAKTPRLAHFARRIWGADNALSDAASAKLAIEKTETFYNAIGMGTRLSDYKLRADDCRSIADKFSKMGIRLGENKAIGGSEVWEILKLAE
jgi:NADP-dependent alcohol dehydrogenase